MTSGKTRGGISVVPLLNRIEDGSKPVVMAIHAQLLRRAGVGAMAGHYRVRRRARSGTAEVKLGIIPGAAGTSACLGGGSGESGGDVRRRRSHQSERSATLGIVDKLIDGDLLAGAVCCREIAAGLRARRVNAMRNWVGGTECADLCRGARCCP